MLIKTADLNGPALDWAVAVAEGREPKLTECWKGRAQPEFQYLVPAYSTDPAQGQPILEREVWVLNRCRSGSDGPIYFEAIIGFEDDPNQRVMTGPTMLIAGLRCFVASKFGDEVDVPEELFSTPIARSFN